MFISAIEEKHFIEAKKILEEKKQFFDKNFIDSEGNTLMHLVVFQLIEGLKTTLAQYRSQHNGADDLDHQCSQIAEKYCSSFFELIDSMLQFGFPCNFESQKTGKPIDTFYSFLQSHPYCKIQLKILAKKFERSTGVLYSGRKYVLDFKLYRASKKYWKVVEIPDKWQLLNEKNGFELTIHQYQGIYCSFSYKDLDRNETNLLVANLGFLVFRKNKSGIYSCFVTLPINASESLVYKKNSQSKHSNQTHSESGLCEVIKSESCQDLIIKYLMSNLKMIKFIENITSDDIFKISSMCLDIFSKNEICYGCGNELYELQKDYTKNSFIKQMETRLNKLNFKIPKLTDTSNPRLKLIIRVKGNLSYGQSGVLNTDYVVPIAHEEYQRNIKTFSHGVMLHSVPRALPSPSDQHSQTKYVSFMTLSTDYDEYKCLEVLNAKKTIYEDIDTTKLLNGRKSMFLYRQTLFANSGGDAAPKNWLNKEEGIIEVSVNNIQESMKYYL